MSPRTFLMASLHFAYRPLEGEAGENTTWTRGRRRRCGGGRRRESFPRKGIKQGRTGRRKQGLQHRKRPSHTPGGHRLVLLCSVLLPGGRLCLPRPHRRRPKDSPFAIVRDRRGDGRASARVTKPAVHQPILGTCRIHTLS